MINEITIDSFSEDESIEITYMECQMKTLHIHKVKKSKYKKYMKSIRDPFSIILKANKEVFFNQGYYDFNYKDMKGLELFMTPVLSMSGDEDNFYYEIIFS